MKFNYMFFIIIFFNGCSSQYEQSNNKIPNSEYLTEEGGDKESQRIDDNYYSFKQCNSKKLCEEFNPSFIKGKYIFKAFDPAVDEFYLKRHNDKYFIFYKNLMVENVEMGWADLELTRVGELDLVFKLNRVYQVYGKFNPIGGGNDLQDVLSAYSKEALYFLDDYYDKYSFNQPQKLTFMKQEDGTLLLDCNSYLKDLDPKNDFSGIFYGVCHGGIKVYFKEI